MVGGGGHSKRRPGQGKKNNSHLSSSYCMSALILNSEMELLLSPRGKQRGGRRPQSQSSAVVQQELESDSTLSWLDTRAPMSCPLFQTGVRVNLTAAEPSQWLPAAWGSLTPGFQSCRAGEIRCTALRSKGPRTEDWDKGQGCSQYKHTQSGSAHVSSCLKGGAALGPRCGF